jgi:hypothetical protein
MPMMVGDGLLDQAFVLRAVSLVPGNLDFGLQTVVSAAINAAAITGALTCTVSVAAYTASNSMDSSQKNDLINRMIERLVNMGYTATLSGTTLTVNWSVM